MTRFTNCKTFRENSEMRSLLFALALLPIIVTLKCHVEGKEELKKMSMFDINLTEVVSDI